MKFSIGDKIVLKYTKEEGEVIAIINKDMVEVAVKGTSFPVYIDDIEHPYLKWFTDKNYKKTQQPQKIELPPEKPEPQKSKLAKGVYLSYIPVYKTIDMEEIIDYFKVYLLNELPTDINFAYDYKLENKSVFNLDGTIHSFSNIYLHNALYENMNDQPRFNWKLIDAVNKNMADEDGVLRIRPSKIFEHINDLLLKSEPSFNYLLIDSFKPKKKAIQKPKFEPIMKPEYVRHITTRNIESAKQEIDLHIEKLVVNYAGMTSSEIIAVQLDTLKRYINLAIVHRQEMMIIIHGLGNGTLKEEVHKELKQIPEVKRFKNEWSAKHGFGATEVWFKYY